MDTALCIELDNNSYPTAHTLDSIELFKGDFSNLMAKIVPLFADYGRCELRDIDDTWEIATGGWSGCEDVIGALKQNHLFWAVCWRLSKRGGYYELSTAR